jgi:uroporphyrinogen decarboxylase
MTALLGHRERVMRTLEYRDIDRIPFYFRADTLIIERLKKRYGLKDTYGIIGYFDADAVRTRISFKKGCCTDVDENGIYYDIFGNKTKVVQYGDISSEGIIKPILADAEAVDDIYSIRWPDSSILDLEESLKHVQFAHSTGLAVYGGAWASIFTEARNMMGEEKFFISMYEDPGVVSALVDRITDFYLDVNRVYFDTCAKYLDIFYLGSDFGTQKSLFISRDLFCRFFKPNIKRLADQAKNYGLKVMFHTCGAVSEIIQDLIDCGIDILDPVQVSAAGMSPSDLAAKYKNKIVFHGGISTQTTLPFGSMEDVREEVTNTVDTLGPLGFIAAPDQEMIGDTPAENMEKMFDTIRNYKLK